MKAPRDVVWAVLRDWIRLSGGWVTRDEIGRLERRMDEIDSLLDKLEERFSPEVDS